VSSNGPGVKKTILLLATSLLLSGCGSDSDRETGSPAAFRLNILHYNDANSALVPEGDFGGAARFTTVLKREQGRGPALSLSAGNNLGPGAQFQASREKGTPFFDALAMNQMGLAASGVGPGEFYYGPDTFRAFVSGTLVPFLSANMDLSSVGGAPGTIVTVDGRSILLVGATAPAIRTISSPAGVSVSEDVVVSVQRHIDAAQQPIVVVIANLGGLEATRELARALRGVDVLVSAGAELLANSGQALVPGDTVSGSYPALERAADGRVIPIVVTGGEYRYLGRLGVTFDPEGEIVALDGTSGPIRIAGGGQPDAVAPDPDVLRTVEEPLRQALAAAAGQVLGSTEVRLDGEDSELQSGETNLGNFLADALLAEAQRLAPTFGVSPAQIALLNSGAVNLNSDLPAGPLTRLNFNEMLPFPSFLVTVPNVSAAHLKELLENSVSSEDARFAQVAGFTLVWDPNGTAQTLDEQGNVVTAGTRVREVTLSGGQQLITGGQVVPGAPAVSIATLDFVARGGDHYPFRGAAFVPMGEDYGTIARRFFTDDLAGIIRATRYPVTGEGRIVRL
jgi:2',3'-cyclic-nucleotide 2'-phosphodiesterase (5'-nucleotidase family)